MQRLLPLAFLLVCSSLLYGQNVSRHGNVVTASFHVPWRAAGPIVTAAPYCANTVVEFQQARRDVAHTCRDSAGRVRTERLFGPDAGVRVVYIQDPVGGFLYALDANNRVVHRIKLGAGIANPPVLAQVIQGQGAPKMPLSHTRESLGEKTLDGLLVTGTLTRTTIPAGRRPGNDQPVTLTAETWWSTDLKIVALRKTSDNRNGDQIEQLENLTRAEPDPNLFQPPPVYQIVDEISDFKFQLTAQ